MEFFPGLVIGFVLGHFFGAKAWAAIKAKFDKKDAP